MTLEDQRDLLISFSMIDDETTTIVQDREDSSGIIAVGVLRRQLALPLVSKLLTERPWGAGVFPLVEC